ncbi:MAG: hypothetical protein PHC30_03380 [Lentisphaeria bacterium]|jgi:hypothetical protein|nr:hypothetical protein [Lentisphaeria bacterium]
MRNNRRLQKLSILLENSSSLPQPRSRLRHHAKTRRTRVWLGLLAAVIAAAALAGLGLELLS